MNKTRILEFTEKLEKYPNILDRFEALLNIAENTSGDLIRADDAEEQLIIEIQKTGATLLEDWAKTQEQKLTANACDNKELIVHSKKNYIGQQSLDK